MKRLQPHVEQYYFSTDTNSTGEYEFFLEYSNTSSESASTPKVIKNFDELIYFFEEFDRSII